MREAIRGSTEGHQRAIIGSSESHQVHRDWHAMQSVAIIRGDQTLLFGNHFLSTRMHILPRSCCLCLLLQLPLHLWGGKGAVVNTCMQLVDLLGGSLDSSRAIKGGRRRSREVEGDRTSSVAALTASGLCFDFSNSSYLMREAIHGNQGALGDVIWAQSLAIKEASSTRERRIERVVHDCEEELHDEEAAEHDDEEEVDPHVPDEGCNQTSSSKLIRLHHYSSDLISGHQDAISGNQDIPRKGLHQIVHQRPSRCNQWQSGHTKRRPPSDRTSRRSTCQT